MSRSRAGTHLSDTLRVVGIHAPNCGVPFDAVLFGVDSVCNDDPLWSHGVWSVPVCQEFKDPGHLPNRRPRLKHWVESRSAPKRAQISDSSKMEVGNLLLPSLFYVGNSCDHRLLVRRLPRY